MKKSQQLVIFIIAIVVVAIGAAAAAIFLTKSNAPVSKVQSNPTPSQTTSSQQAATSKTVNDATKLAYDGNLQAGVQKLSDAIKGTTDTQQQFIYYSQLATLLLNANQLPAALDAAKKAYSLNAVSDSAALVGQIAQQMGDTATAVEYYKDAISHIDPNDNPYAKTDKDYYQGIIDGLQGKK